MIWARSKNIQHFGTGPMLWGTGPICMGLVLSKQVHKSICLKKHLDHSSRTPSVLNNIFSLQTNPKLSAGSYIYYINLFCHSQLMLIFDCVNIFLVVVLVRLPGSNCAVLLVNIAYFLFFCYIFFLRFSSILKNIEVIFLFEKLRLSSIYKKLRSSSIFKTIEAIFHFWTTMRPSVTKRIRLHP